LAQLLIWGDYVNSDPFAAIPELRTATEGILLQSDVAATGILKHFFQQAALCSGKIKLVGLTVRQGVGNRRESGRQAGWPKSLSKTPREVKKLGRPGTTPHLVDWSRKTVGISAEIERVETRAHAGSWVRCPVLRPVARM